MIKLLRIFIITGLAFTSILFISNSVLAFNFSSISKELAKAFGKAATNHNELKAVAKTSKTIAAKEINNADKVANGIYVPPQVVGRSAYQSYNNYQENKKRNNYDTSNKTFSNHLLGISNYK